MYKNKTARGEADGMGKRNGKSLNRYSMHERLWWLPLVISALAIMVSAVKLLT